MPPKRLRLKKAVLVRSNYIPHTFNPCGDVTMSYLPWKVSKLGMNIQLNLYHLAVSGFHLGVWVVVFQ